MTLELTDHELTIVKASVRMMRESLGQRAEKCLVDQKRYELLRCHADASRCVVTIENQHPTKRRAKQLPEAPPVPQEPA